MIFLRPPLALTQSPVNLTFPGTRPRSRRSRRQAIFLIVVGAFTLAAGYFNSRLDAPGTARTTITLKTFIEPIKVAVVDSGKAGWIWGAGDGDRYGEELDEDVEEDPEFEAGEDDLGGTYSPAGKSRPPSKYKPPLDVDVPPSPPPQPILEKHHYNPNGLLEVNPHGPHPLYELIGNAEREWKQKLERASRTLGEAVTEYERRYGRKPPRGFDKWWDYVEKHNVQLPDEYDQIHRDLEAFWGIDPLDLQSVEMKHELYYQVESFTIGKLTPSDPISILNKSAAYSEGFKKHDMTGTAHVLMRMLRDAGVERFIPPFRATVSPYDNPTMVTDWELWSQGVNYAREGKTFSMLNPPRKSRTNGWLSACDPSSPAWVTPLNFTSPPTNLRPSSDPLSETSTRTFIHNHKLTMDPCTHPHLFLQHGQFLKYNSGRGPNPLPYLTPYFSYSPTMLHHDITAAFPFNWVRDLPRDHDPEWEDKTDERLHWRGSNTGTSYANKYRWWLSHRTRLMEFAQRGWEGLVRVVGVGVGRGEEVGEGKVVRKGMWASAMLDVAFTGGPVQCSKEEGVCEELKRMFEFRKGVTTKEAGRFKWILDIDGNAWSSRFKRLITSSSCIFKSTIYPEWYTDRIQPWVHYIPIQIDLSDLWDVLAFFRGDPNGDFNHDDLGKKIGAQGRDWSLGFWREEDMVAYNFRLFLEYARVMSTEREEMSYVHVEEDMDG